mgnify:CR=1 FL=1
MHNFSQYLKEATAGKATKNLHLEHLEDDILNNGYIGFQKAIRTLNGVVVSLKGNEPSSHDITLKYDGSPALVAGIDPATGKFFVGTKGVFNVTPKLNFTNKDIDTNHPAEGLNDKLKLALKYLKGLGIQGILQGDLMFTSDSIVKEKIDGESYLTFQANTIKYAVDPTSVIGKAMAAAKIGIVFHTAYVGDTIQTVKASFNPSLTGLKKSRSVWFDNATLKQVGKSVLFSKSEMETLKYDISSATKTANSIKIFMNSFAKNEAVKAYTKIYINSLVRSGLMNPTASGLIAFVQSKAKNPKETETAKYIQQNQRSIDILFNIHTKLSNIKLHILKKISNIEMDVTTFVRSGNGYKVTAPEGLVAIDKLSNSALKLVDRLEFSKSNFDTAKRF